MKKTLLVCMLLIAIVLSFAACGGKDNPPSNSGGNGNETPVHTHNFGEWETTVKPTCTENGTKVRYCSCGEKQSENVAMLGHTPAEAVVEDKIEATYESNGSYNEVVRCLTCNEKLSEASHTIPMLKHTPSETVTENVVDATCYSEGSYDTVVYCSDCGTELERTKHTVEKLSHTPASAVEENVIDSTCYSVGSKDLVVYCSVPECHAFIEKSSVTIDKKAHSPASAVEENRVNPTYENDGSYQMVVYCSVAACHAELERTTHTLDMLVHHPGTAVIENEVEATCTKKGSYDEVVYCLDADCGHKELSRKTITTDMISHTSGTAVEENRVDATCYSEGSYDNVVYCAVCNTELSRNTVTLQKIAHTPAEAVVENLVNATCTANGSYDEVVYCSVENCKVQISRTTKVIDALEHDFVDGSCAVCGETDPNYTPENPGYSVGLEYISNGDGTCYVSGIGTCTDTDIVIPSTSPEGWIVIGVGKYAFSCRYDLTSVTVPDSVISIGESAFAYSKIPNLTLTDSIISIGDFAFSGWHYTDLILPSSLITIGNAAFQSCKFNKVIIPNGVKSIGENVFGYSYNDATIVYYIGSEQDWNAIAIDTENEELINATRYYYSETEPTEAGNFWHYVDGVPTVWPEYVAPEIPEYSQGLEYTSNGDGTCYVSGIGTCADTNIIIPAVSPNGEQVIGTLNSAFSQCSSIKSVILSEGIKEIGCSSFRDCISLKNIEIPNSVTYVCCYAFGGCTALNKTVYDNAYYLGNRNNPHLILLTAINENIHSCNIHKETKVIYAEAFTNCTQIQSIFIPEKVIDIGYYAFYGCTNLNFIYYNGNVSEKCIMEYSFENIGSNCELRIGKNVTMLPEMMFDYSGIKYITFESGSNCQVIDDFSFSSSVCLISVVIPSSMQYINHGAFARCKLLDIVYYEGSESEWNQINIVSDTYNEDLLNATRYYYSETQPTEDGNFWHYVDGVPTAWPEYVAPKYSEGLKFTSNGDGTCYVSGIGTCKDTDIIIPKKSPAGDTVTSIGEFAFYDNTLPASIIIPDSVTSIGRFAFYYCTALTSVTLPNSVTNIDTHAFAGCTALTSIVIPDSVTSIGDSAFYDSTSLTIYCETTSKPNGWDNYWNFSNRPVVWGYEE